ncbi:hypothetical protein V1525DRAFT_85983 [Lipomyces kononenkoae]|uniref:Uncharacterized protein n=1 Tax=Lipomyces kononenkoae TaxID=34357 RepID=A0ACC3T4L2_LIPKO
MPVGFVSGIARTPLKDVFGWLEQDHLIKLWKFVYVGLRDADEAEQKIISEKVIKAFTIDDVRWYGIQRVMDLAIEYVANETLCFLRHRLFRLAAIYRISSSSRGWV